MKEEKLFEVIGEIDEKYVANARAKNKKKKVVPLTRWTAIAACVCVVAGSAAVISNYKIFRQGNSGDTTGAGQYAPGFDENTAGKDTVDDAYEDIWGGTYTDSSGKQVVLLTENTLDNQADVFANNPDLQEEDVSFETADYSLAYLNEITDNIHEEMQDGNLPFVTSAELSEQLNRVEVCVTTDDEDAVNQILSFDMKGGAIILHDQQENYADYVTDRTFVYDKEGVEGEFTIHIDKDGTFSYSEGIASSYLGYGNWSVEDNILTITDDMFTNRFEIEEGKLIWREEGSDNFTYIKLTDGEEFTED